MLPGDRMRQLALAVVALVLGALLAWAITARAPQAGVVDTRPDVGPPPAAYADDLAPSGEPARASARVPAHEPSPAIERKAARAEPGDVPERDPPDDGGSALVGRLLDERGRAVRGWKVRVWLTTDGLPGITTSVRYG